MSKRNRFRVEDGMVHIGKSAAMVADKFLGLPPVDYTAEGQSRIVQIAIAASPGGHRLYALANDGTLLFCQCADDALPPPLHLWHPVVSPGDIWEQAAEQQRDADEREGQ